MRLFIYACILAGTVATFSACKEQTSSENNPSTKVPFALAIHGGAGALAKGSYTAEQEAEYHATLKKAAQLGYDMLSRGDSAADVVVAVIKVLEDSPLFNAGRGAVITNNGKIKMDACIMHGGTLDCGSINNVQRIKNPITAARMVMDSSRYIMFSSSGAERFAELHGIEMVDKSYFYTPHQVERWRKTKDSTEVDYIHYVDSMMQLNQSAIAAVPEEGEFGTVGCVVLDKYGNLVAGTSTGGLINKKYNRIGDSPVIGAGTYANNKTCAISCTGTGEDFIKTVAAKTVSDLMEMKGMTLDAATYDMIHVRFKEITGDGGMIAVDHNGNISFQYNSDGMFRASADAQGNIRTWIYE